MNNLAADRSESNRAGTDCLVAFGSNEGNSVEIYRDVHKRLAQIAWGEVLASQLYGTEAVGGPKQNDFLNGAYRFATERSLTELHRELIDIETEFGRKKRQRWGVRRIDLDLSLYGEQIFATASLRVPHPRMSFRRFVLEPANEIAAGMKHPTSGLTIGELLARINSPGNKLIWITQQSDIAAELIVEFKTAYPDWDFCLIERGDRAEFDFGSVSPKLMVRDFASPERLLGAASLDLPGCSREEIKIEILAALKSMEPASRT